MKKRNMHGPIELLPRHKGMQLRKKNSIIAQISNSQHEKLVCVSFLHQ